MRALAYAALLAGCGRLGFGERPTGDANDGRGPIGDDGRRTGANLAFVTTATITASFGGIAPADAICASAAVDAGWSGTFVAWLSDSTTDARDRLAGSHGWVRVDGAPVANTVTDWLDGGQMFNPIDRDAHGAPVIGLAWTGTLATGRVSTSTCGDWSGAGTGASGSVTSAMPRFAQTGNYGCQASHHLYCFEVGRSVDVAPAPVAGRLAFISSSGRTSAARTLADLDARCQADAVAAGRPGNYLAAAATPTASIASRFVTDTRPWTRCDGTLVAGGGASLFTGPDPSSFVNQLADGTYVTDLTFVAGAARADLAGDLTCTNWSAFNNGSLTYAGYPEDAALDQFWDGGPSPGSNTVLCNDTTPRALCLQQ